MWLAGSRPLKISGSPENPFDSPWMDWVRELPRWRQDEHAELLKAITEAFEQKGRQRR
jgi:hypothetical protein